MRRRRTPAEPQVLRQLPEEYATPVFRQRAAARRRALMQRLRSLYRRPGLTLYVGAGVQQSIDLPGWRDLIASLTIDVMERSATPGARRRGELRRHMSGHALADIRKAVAAYNRPLLMMARAIKSFMGSDLPAAIAGTLYWSGGPVSQYMFDEVLEAGRRKRAYPRLPSSELMHALVAIAFPRAGVAGVQAVVNYNYDDLLDEKLRESGIKAVTVTSGRRVPGRDQLPCYHVHGVLPFWRYVRGARRTDKGNFLFSEDEYHGEYADPYRWSNIVQTRLLSNSTGLFVGLSLEDPNIRRLIDTTHRQFPRSRQFAILKRGKSLAERGKSRADAVANLFEEVETRAFASMGVHVLWVDEFEEMPSLVRAAGRLEHVPIRRTDDIWDDFPLVAEFIREAQAASQPPRRRRSRTR